MPRLTFEALMAPGGLLDAGSRLTQTLIETPFKREQMRQGIREQEIGRAEQRNLRAIAFAREDKLRDEQNKREDARVEKKGRIDYYGAKASQADARYAAAMKQAGDNFEKKMLAQIKAKGGDEKQQAIWVKMMEQASSNVNAALQNKDLQAKFTNDPAFFSTTYKQAHDALMEQFGDKAVTTSGMINATTMQDSNVDEQLIKELEMSAQESIGAWENLRIETGAAKSRVDAHNFMQKNGLGTETDGLPKGPSGKKLGVPGAEPAKPIVTNADAGAVNPNAPLALNTYDAVPPPVIQGAMRPEDIRRTQLTAMADLLTGAGKTNVDTVNTAIQSGNTAEDSMYNAGDVTLRANDDTKRLADRNAVDAATTSRAMDPDAQGWQDTLMSFGEANVPPEQMPEYLRLANLYLPAGSGTLSAARQKTEDAAKLRRTQRNDYHELNGDISPQARQMMGAFQGVPLVNYDPVGMFPPTRRISDENAIMDSFIFDRLARAAAEAKKGAGTAGPARLTAPPNFDLNPYAR